MDKPGEQSEYLSLGKRPISLELFTQETYLFSDLFLKQNASEFLENLKKCTRSRQ